MNLEHIDPSLATKVALHAYAIECNRLLMEIELKARPLHSAQAPGQPAEALPRTAARAAQRLAARIGEPLALTSVLHDAARALDSLGTEDADAAAASGSGAVSHTH